MDFKEVTLSKEQYERLVPREETPAYAPSRGFLRPIALVALVASTIMIFSGFGPLPIMRIAICAATSILVITDPTLQKFGVSFILKAVIVLIFSLVVFHI